MQAKSETLDNAVKAFLDALPRGGAAQTFRTKRRALEILTEIAGRKNRSVRKLTEDDFVKALQKAADGATPEENEKRRLAGLAPRTGRTPASLNPDKTAYGQFIRFCQRRGWMDEGFDPVYEITESSRAQGDLDPERARHRRSVPFEEWGALLDTAGAHHPRSRMTVAIGLAWGRRIGDTARMQWHHLRLDRGIDDQGEPLPDLVELYNSKKGRPQLTGGLIIAPWMRAEIDRYRAWVEATYGPVQGDWYLCPAKVPLSDPGVVNPLDSANWPLIPNRRADTPGLLGDIKHALRGHGWTDRMLLGEGGHTLRRSASIHIENVASREAAQALMDHSSAEQTSYYTGNRKGHRELGEAMLGASVLPGRPATAPTPASEHCAACEATLTPSARFCGQCGHRVAPATCGGCEASLTPSARFCDQCGRPADGGFSGNVIRLRPAS